MLIIYLFIIVSALIGLSISLNIYKKKREHTPLVCPFGADCHTVITGQFSSFMGIGLEIFGALYYGFIIVAYTIFMVFPSTLNEWTLFLLTGATIGAMLFSIYLTFVQAFVIKSWCSWCLMSAGVSIAIFLFTMIELSLLPISILPIIELLQKPILWMHLLGFALGVGGATISDILFFRFLKDFKISEEEDKVLKIMSQIIWVGLALVIISGIGLYLPNMEALNQNPKFLLKMFVVGVIAINGAFLNLLISPKLVIISWKDNGFPIKKITRLRKLAFALGAVSFVSWYSAFTLGIIKTVPYTFLQILGLYIGLIIIVVVMSQVIERSFCKSSSTNA